MGWAGLLGTLRLLWGERELSGITAWGPLRALVTPAAEDSDSISRVPAAPPSSDKEDGD